MNLSTSVTRDPRHIAITKNVFTVVLSVSIILFNSALVHTFRNHQVLLFYLILNQNTFRIWAGFSFSFCLQVFFTNPRYILYIHLVINDIIMLALFLILQLISYVVFTLNVSFCIVLLIIAVSSNLNNPLTLAAMALECYLAVCFPLRYPQVCTVRRTCFVIGAVWFLSMLTVLPDVCVLLATNPMEFFSSSIFCLWANVFTDPTLSKKKEVSNIAYLVIVWLILFYAYFRILFAAQAASANARKARNTVLLHGFQLLLCMLSYVHSISIQGLSSLFPKDVLAIRYVISVLIQILPRLISPIVYGLRDKMFREYLQKSLLPLRKTGVFPDRTLGSSS